MSLVKFRTLNRQREKERDIFQFPDFEFPSHCILVLRKALVLMFNFSMFETSKSMRHRVIACRYKSQTIIMQCISHRSLAISIDLMNVRNIVRAIEVFCNFLTNFDAQ